MLQNVAQAKIQCAGGAHTKSKAPRTIAADVFRDVLFQVDLGPLKRHSPEVTF
jgi:hypothetical protein